MNEVKAPERYWIEIGFEREAAFQWIARALGKEHPITQMMDSLAYGKHPWELKPNPDPRLRLENAIERAVALEGAFHILRIWARDHDPDAHDIMQTIWHGSPVGVGQAGQTFWEANSHLFSNSVPQGQKQTKARAKPRAGPPA